MRNEPKFVTPDMFKNRFGIDLNESLDENDNISNKANIFLMMVEDNLMSWVDANTFRNVSWDGLTQYQLEKLQLAILYQALYTYKNGDILLDSGYDQEKGIIANHTLLQEIAISPTSINYLKTAGLYNHVVNNVRRYVDFR